MTAVGVGCSDLFGQIPLNEASPFYRSFAAYCFLTFWLM
jgi:hypothetical protein